VQAADVGNTVKCADFDPKSRNIDFLAVRPPFLQRIFFTLRKTASDSAVEVAFWIWSKLRQVEKIRLVAYCGGCESDTQTFAENGYFGLPFTLYLENAADLPHEPIHFQKLHSNS